MRKLLHESGFAFGLALFAAAAHAAQLEEVQTFVGTVVLYAVLLFVIVVVCYVYFMRLRDKRAAPLSRLFEGRATIHSVAADTLVMECVRLMTAKKIGALIVMNGDELAGIFTERDALNRVLAAGLDPRNTKVSAVMTKDPYCAPPTTTVAAAMELVTKRRFRHLPIVDKGKVLAVVSSGDLTHWLVRDQMGEVQGLVELAARS